MKHCLYCHEKLKWDQAKGWVHQNGSWYHKTKQGHEHCVLVAPEGVMQDEKDV